MKVLVVGAGVAGMTAAVLLKRKGHEVLVLEQRKEIGGNCVDMVMDEVRFHVYGPHIFHTSDIRVWRFINEFTGFTGYLHKVMADIGTKLVTIPYSKRTAEEIGRDLSDGEIVDTFFRLYSERMWGCEFSQIPPQITKRVNLRRTNYDTRYFLDKYQGMPSNGYAAMFEAMHREIGDDAIQTRVEPDYWKLVHKDFDLVVYTGMLDEYFGCEHGRLPYRAVSLKFEHNQEPTKHAVVNFCHSGAASRVTDYSKFYSYPKGTKTTLCTEYPMQWASADPDLVPSYPMVGFPEAEKLKVHYKGLKTQENVVFCGRLATYKYLNMDQAIGDTMSRLEKKLGTTLYDK